MKNSIIIILILLSNVAFTQNKTKMAVTQSLVGKYELSNICGYMIPDNLINYDKKNGKWKGIISWIKGDQRKTDIKITTEVLKKLNSMEFIVNPNLSIVFSCNGTQIVNIPFKEDGMIFKIEGTHDESSPFGLDKIKPELTFQDSELYLYAKDNVDYSEIQTFDITNIEANIVIIIYDTRKNEFNVLLGVDGGMGNGWFTTYSFKKKLVVKK